MSSSLHLVNEDDSTGLGSPLPVRLSRIHRFEGQPRRYFDQKGLEDLADDIKANGQKTPVRVCKHSSERGVFVLIGGERRWRAFGIIRDESGTDPIVNCFIDAVHDERHHFREALLDNLHREDLIPLDEAAAYQRLYSESGAGSHRAKVLEISVLVKKSFTHIENYLALHSLPDDVKRFMDPRRPRDERLTVSAAIEIARSTRDKKLQLSIAEESIERSLGIADTRGLISVRTGKSGYGIGGRLRKPADDYKAFKNFVGSTLNRARRINTGLDLAKLYDTRETVERNYDIGLLQEIVGHFQRMVEAAEKKTPPAPAPSVRRRS